MKRLALLLASLLAACSAPTGPSAPSAKRDARIDNAKAQLQGATREPATGRLAAN